MGKYKLQTKKSDGTFEDVDLTANVDLSEYVKIKTGTLCVGMNSEIGIDVSGVKNFVFMLYDVFGDYDVNLTVKLKGPTISVSGAVTLFSGGPVSEGYRIEKIGDLIMLYDPLNGDVFTYWYTWSCTSITFTATDLAGTTSSSLEWAYKLEK